MAVPQRRIREHIWMSPKRGESGRTPAVSAAAPPLPPLQDV